MDRATTASLMIAALALCGCASATVTLGHGVGECRDGVLSAIAPAGESKELAAAGHFNMNVGGETSYRETKAP